jgi:hypothetical protein
MAQVFKSSSEVADQNTILADWSGAKTEIWIFHLTFRRLALLLRLPQRSEVLYVVCLGCRHINGPFRWRDAKLAISDGVQSGGENCKRVYDLNGQFELICDGGVVLHQCAEIVNSFEDFQFPA